MAANERLVVLEAERAEDSARVVSDTEGAIRAELSAAMAACEAERERSADLARQLSAVETESSESRSVLEQSHREAVKALQAELSSAVASSEESHRQLESEGAASEAKLVEMVAREKGLAEEARAAQRVSEGEARALSAEVTQLT